MVSQPSRNNRGPRIEKPGAIKVAFTKGEQEVGFTSHSMHVRGGKNRLVVGDTVTLKLEVKGTQVILFKIEICNACACVCACVCICVCVCMCVCVCVFVEPSSGGRCSHAEA
jgi:hypothetical protein